MDAIKRSRLPFKTITWDNGTEFHGYRALEQATGVRCYFAYPHHPWERGSNENFNGREGRVTFTRELRHQETETEVLDLDHPFVQDLLSRARSYDFQGLTAGTTLSGFGHVVTAMLRWQDERGQRLRQEFLAVAMDGEGELHANPPGVVSWYLETMGTDRWQVERDATREVHDNIERFIDNQLARKSNANLHPENREWLGAAWCREGARNEGRGAP